MSEKENLNIEKVNLENLIERANIHLSELESSAKNSRLILNEISSRKSKYQTNLTSLRRFSNSADEVLLNAREKRKEIQTLLTQVSKYYSKTFIPLKSKIEDPEVGLKATIKESQRFSKELSFLQNETHTYIDDIKERRKEFNTALTQIRKINKSASEIFQSITEEKISSNELLKQLNTLNESAIKATKNIQELEETAIANEGNISNLEKKSKNNHNRIELHHEEAERLKNEIDDVYQIATNTGLAGSFDSRRQQLREQVKLHEIKITISLALLFGSIISLYLYQISLLKYADQEIKFTVDFYLRFLMTSPLIFYTVFVSQQYQETKKLLDKYAFKTIAS